MTNQKDPKSTNTIDFYIERIVLQLLSELDKETVDLLMISAVPHSFTLESIKFVYKSKIDLMPFINKISNLSFIVNKNQSFFFHDSIRQIILLKFMEQPTKYQDINNKYFNYYSSFHKENEKRKLSDLNLELLYHLLGANQRKGIEFFSRLFAEADASGYLEYCERIIKYVEEQNLYINNQQVEKWIIYLRAKLYIQKGVFSQGQKLLLRLKENTKDPNLLYYIYHSLGFIQGRLGDPQVAIKNHIIALKQANYLNNYSYISNEYYQLGRNYKRLGNFKKAIESHSNGIIYQKKSDNPYFEYTIWLDLGNVYTYMSEWKNAEIAFLTSLQGFKKFSNIGRAESLQRLGWLRRMTGQLDEAHDLHLQAIITFRKIGKTFQLGEALHSLGLVYKDELKWNNALDVYKEAFNIFTSLSAERHIGIILKDISYIELMLGKPNKKILNQVIKSINILKTANDESSLAEAYAVESTLYSKLGQAEKAKVLIEKSIAKSSHITNPELLMRLMLNDIENLWENAIYDGLLKKISDLNFLALSNNYSKYIAKAQCYFGLLSLIQDNDNNDVSSLLASLIFARNWNNYLLKEIIKIIDGGLKRIEIRYGEKRKKELTSLIVGTFSFANISYLRVKIRDLQ